MISRLERILVSLMLAGILAAVTFWMASAQGQTPPVASTDCAACHADQTLRWENGAHGQASQTFQAEWQKQGSPAACAACHLGGDSAAAGLTCVQCHNPVPANHPVENMPIDSSPALCADCHANPAFSQTDWQKSAHYQNAIACDACHDPHTTGPRLEQAQNGNISALCLNCHQGMKDQIAGSIHAQKGVSCADCHLGQETNQTTDFSTAHNAPSHAFRPTAQTCARCHAGQMHAPGAASGGSPQDVNAALQQPVSAPVGQTPSPVSPFGFSLVAGLLGLASGMALCPWLERLYRRLTSGGRS